MADDHNPPRRAKAAGRLLRRDDPRPGDRVELPARPTPRSDNPPNQITVAGLTVEVIDQGGGNLDLLFRGEEDFRVKGGRMGRLPVSARFKVKGGVVVTLHIEKV